MLRRLLAAVTLVAAVTLLNPLSVHAQACGTTTTVGCLTATDVTNAVQGALTAISPDTMVVAVVDRAGTPLAVFRKAGAPATVIGNFGATVDANDQAVGLARTGAFFSNDQAPLSSRTVRFISGIHFPPGTTNKPPAALYGIENTNRGCALGALDAVVPRATSLAGGACTGGAGNQGRLRHRHRHRQGRHLRQQPGGGGRRRRADLQGRPRRRRHRRDRGDARRRRVRRLHGQRGRRPELRTPPCPSRAPSSSKACGCRS